MRLNGFDDLRELLPGLGPVGDSPGRQREPMSFSLLSFLLANFHRVDFSEGLGAGDAPLQSYSVFRHDYFPSLDPVLGRAALSGVGRSGVGFLGGLFASRFFMSLLRSVGVSP